LRHDNQRERTADKMERSEIQRREKYTIIEREKQTKR
jgi:hypothetical protein